MNQKIESPIHTRNYSMDRLAQEHGVFLVKTKNGDWHAYETFSGQCIRRGSKEWVNAELKTLGAHAIGGTLLI